MAQSSSFSKDAQQALRELKQQLKVVENQSKAVVAAKNLQAVKTAPTPIDEEILFKQAMSGVQPIKQEEVPVLAPVKPKKPTAQILAKRAAAVGQDELSSHGISDTQAMLNPVASEATLSYRLGTLQHRVFQQLKAGTLRWYEAVDLHGCTIEEARTAVLQIIEMARNENQNVIKIVHGKGPQAILKTYVNGWLRQHREVLAFVSAPAEQGGTGAVLVLLKRAETKPAPQKR